MRVRWLIAFGLLPLSTAWSCGGDDALLTDGGTVDAAPADVVLADTTLDDASTDRGGIADAAAGDATETDAPVEAAVDAGVDAVVGILGPCLADADILYLNGDPADFIHPGEATITSATFTATLTPASAPDTVRVSVTPTDAGQGSLWDLAFSSAKLGVPLDAGVYLDAEREPFASAGHPGLEVSGDGRGCNTLTGAFQIEELGRPAFMASFEQHCEGADAALRGCVRVRAR